MCADIHTRPILYTDYIWICIPVFEYYFWSYTHLIGINVCKHSHSFHIRYTDLFEYIFLTFEYHFEKYIHLIGMTLWTHCNTLQHTATHCNSIYDMGRVWMSATHCNTLQHYIHTLSILCTDCIWLHSHKHCIWLHIHKHNPYSWMQFWLLYTFIVSPNAPSTLYLIT